MRKMSAGTLPDSVEHIGATLKPTLAGNAILCTDNPALLYFVHGKWLSRYCAIE